MPATPNATKPSCPVGSETVVDELTRSNSMRLPNRSVPFALKIWSSELIWLAWITTSDNTLPPGKLVGQPTGVFVPTYLLDSCTRLSSQLSDKTFSILKVRSASGSLQVFSPWKKPCHPVALLLPAGMNFDYRRKSSGCLTGDND